MLKSARASAAAVCTAAFVLVALGDVASAATPRKVGIGGEITLDFRNERLPVIVEKIAREAGVSFLFDDQLRGRVTITVAHPVSSEEALAILDAALMMRGFVALQNGTGLRKVLPIKDAVSGAPWERRTPDERGARLVTTLVRLEVAPVEEVAAKLQHLVGQTDSVIAYPPTNSLILVGAESRIRRLMELSRALDAGGLGELTIRTLRHRDAAIVADLIADVFEPKPGHEPLSVWVDKRTNSLVLLGTNEQLAELRVFLDQLDRAPETEGRIRVVRVRNRDAEELAKILSAMSLGRSLARGKGPGRSLVGREFFVAADPPTNSLLIDADPDTFALLERVIEELDRAQPRILVEVTAYEVQNPSSMKLGTDWFLPVITPNSPGDTIMTLTSNPSGGGLRGEIGPDLTFFGRASREPLVLPFVDADGTPALVVLPRETGVVTAFEREVRTRILMRPRLLMISGEEQELFVGQNVPIPVGQAGQGVFAARQTRQQIERQDVGVVLRVKPQLGERGKVKLDLHIELSRVTQSVAGDVNTVGPTITKRQLDTTAILSDGELVVLGMSQQQQQDATATGTPFLRDIPILGHLVSAKTRDDDELHLIIAVQARVLRSTTEDLAESIRQRIALERSFARVQGLKRNPDAPYALLLDTRSDEDTARTIAESFASEGAIAQVGRWKSRGELLYDIYLTGYVDLSVAGADALALRRRGWAPQVVVLPGEIALAHIPAFRPFAGR